MAGVELGCGLIAIGRQWGTTPTIPSEAEALHFLESAYELGVRIFDTAPSYGLSEDRLGKFLHGLGPDERKQVTVATKFGEHWDAATQTGYADHSYDALRRSLDTSMRQLGDIAFLQLHKTTPELFDDDDVARAFEYARQVGAVLGVSASDPVSADLAVHGGRFGVIQLPYNQASPQFKPAISSANEVGKKLLINRPFQMGRVTATADRRQAAIHAFGFILKEDFEGAILTGTSNIDHLRENMQAFQTAQEQAI